MTSTKNNKKTVSTPKVQVETKKTVSTPKVQVETKKTVSTPKVQVETKVDILKGMDLPPVEVQKVPQHIICMELAKLGYRAKQVSEITNIKLTNVSWYFSKYKLNELVKQFHESQKK